MWRHGAAVRGRALTALAALPAAALIAVGARAQEVQGPPVAPGPGGAAPVESTSVAGAGSSTPAAVRSSTPTSSTGRARRARRGLTMRGMGLPLRSLDPAFDHGPLLAELPGLGVTHVALFVDMWQPDATSQAPARHPLRTPSDRALRRTISQARGLGLEVVLVPGVQLERDLGGSLRPPSWARWFQGYRRGLLHWARLAEDEGVALLCVGSGLSTADEREASWRDLIRAVRAEFSGELTYSTRRDRLDVVGFWDALDHVGLSASFELTTSSEPTPEELEAAWLRQRRALATWRQQRGLDRQILLLEVGYPSRDGGAAQPRGDDPAAGVDLEEQRLCYEAFAKVWGDAPEMLAGAFFHEWWGEGGRRDATSTPRGKPAAEVLKAFFGGPAEAP